MHNATFRCFMHHVIAMDLFSYTKPLDHPPERGPVYSEYLGGFGLVSAGHFKYLYYISSAHLFKRQQVFARHGRCV